MAANKDSDNAKSISIAEWQKIFGNIDNDEEFDGHTYNHKKVQRMNAQNVRCGKLWELR